MSATACFFSAASIENGSLLVRGLRKRDPAVIERIIEQYQYRLFRYLIHICGNREMAEDVFQETWVRVLDRGHQYDGRRPFETWLFAISRNLVIDMHRRKAPQPLDDLTESMVPANSTLSPLACAARSEENADLEACVAGLPAVYREVLILRFQEDLALAEIATVIGAPLSTVKSRLYRGLELLRSAVQGANR